MVRVQHAQLRTGEAFVRAGCLAAIPGDWAADYTDVTGYRLCLSEWAPTPGLLEALLRVLFLHVSIGHCCA